MNTWLGFAPNWGGAQAVLANLARLGIQAGIPATAGISGAAGLAVGSVNCLVSIGLNSRNDNKNEI